MAGPVSCIETHPTRRSIIFAGKPISLMQVSRATGIDQGQLSRLLSGMRKPEDMSLGQHLKAAAALGMSLEDYLEAIYERRREKLNAIATDLHWHNYRMAKERAEDNRRLSQGLPIIPRLV